MTLPEVPRDKIVKLLMMPKNRMNHIQPLLECVSAQNMGHVHAPCMGTYGTCIILPTFAPRAFRIVNFNTMNAKR